jgi:hypothetical protein
LLLKRDFKLLTKLVKYDVRDFTMFEEKKRSYVSVKRDETGTGRFAMQAYGWHSGSKVDMAQSFLTSGASGEYGARQGGLCSRCVFAVRTIPMVQRPCWEGDSCSAGQQCVDCEGSLSYSGVRQFSS